jgi:hypothetical protein
MGKSRAIRLAFVVAVLLSAREASAQVFTPSFMAPGLSSDVGVYLSDGPGSFSVEGIWRRTFGDYDLGLRGGVADTDELSVLFAAEYRNPLDAGAPIDLSVTGAAQGVIGGRSGIGIVAGLSIGESFGGPDVMVTPYLHPRVGIVDGFGARDFELELLADVGIDIRFSPELEFRLGIGIDNNATGFGVGFSWR